MTTPETYTQYAVQGRIEGTDSWAYLDHKSVLTLTHPAMASWSSDLAEAERQEQQAQKYGGWKDTRIVARTVSEPWVVTADA